MKQTLCPEHRTPLIGSLGDGVLIGSCPECGRMIARVNPVTGQAEWLDGQSPWTPEPLRPIDDD